MDAIAWVLGIGIFVGLLLAFPKRMMILVAVIMAIGLLLTGGYFGFSYYNASVREAEARSISVDVLYLPAQCDPEFPIAITFTNNSERTVTSIRFKLEGFQEGHSNPVFTTTYARYETDVIVRPRAGSGQCWRLPEPPYGTSLERMIADFPPATLRWEVSAVTPTFAED